MSISTSSGASSSSTSTCAPSRISRLQPCDVARARSPGTATTSRPWARARFAVMSAPLRTAASTTISTPDNPLMIRFRCGNRHGSGAAPGPNSDTIAPPPSRIRSASARLDFGYITSIPEPSTATVGIPDETHPRCAAPSMPRANPLTTGHPAAPMTCPSRSATPSP